MRRRESLRKLREVHRLVLGIVFLLVRVETRARFASRVLRILLLAYR